MPELESIVKTEVTIPIQMFGHAILVTYRPFIDLSAYSIDPATNQLERHDQIAKFFCLLVSAWDMQLNGAPLLINEVTTRPGGPIPFEIMGMIVGAIAEDKEILTKKIRQNVYTHRIAEIDEEQRSIAAHLELKDEEREAAE